MSEQVCSVCGAKVVGDRWFTCMHDPLWNVLRDMLGIERVEAKVLPGDTQSHADDDTSAQMNT